MPLSSSPSNGARQQNIRTEIAAGRKPAQAVAIGYGQQRRNKTLAEVKAARRTKT
jgi:hypothetical protein